MTRGRTLAVGALLVGALGAFTATHFAVSTDLMQFVPNARPGAVERVAREVMRSELSRTMLLLVGAGSPDAAIDAARRLEETLAGDPRVAPRLAFLEGGPPEGIDEALWSLYYPRRLSFVAPDAEAARALVSDEGLRGAAAKLADQLARPLSTLVSRIAPADPLLALPGLFERLEATQRGGLKVVDGRFLTEDGRQAVLLLGTHASAFDGAVQGPLLDHLAEAFERVRAASPEPITLQTSGVNRFAVRAEHAIRADIRRVSILSVVGLTVLFVVLFRSLRLVALASLPIGIGMLSGTAATLALFGQIHGITLAFGMSLIGVCIDYVVHFYCHHNLMPAPDGPAATLRRIWGGLVLGAATTVAGFAALGGSAFPGLRQVALFASVGIGTALLTTRWLLPPLMPDQPRPPALLGRIGRGLEAGLRWTKARRGRLWVLPGAALVLTIAMAPRVRWEDDFANLQRLDPSLVAEDAAVTAKVARFEQLRFVLAVGPDEDTALAVNDRVAQALEDAERAGDLRGFRNVRTLLPSPQRQREVAAAVLRSPDLDARFDRAFAAAGFRTEGFAAFHALLREDPPPALRFDDLLASPLAPLVRAFRVTLDDQVAFVSFLHELRDPDALGERLAGIDGAWLLDQKSLLTGAYRAYRERTIELVTVGLGFVLLLVAFRYRDARLTLAAVLPALLATGVTVATLTLMGIALNLLALTALLMVLSMGVDYGVFLAETTTRHPEGMAGTLLSLIVACVSTVLGFGLLALSDHPALMIIGLSAGIGVTASLLLAPTTLVLLRDVEAP